MKREQWLDLIDLFRRILTILRRLLADLWGDAGDAAAVPPEV